MQPSPELLAFREAHIEAVEPGAHVVTVGDQDGCTISKVRGSRGENVRAGKHILSLEVTFDFADFVSMTVTSFASGIAATRSDSIRTVGIAVPAPHSTTTSRARSLRRVMPSCAVAI